MKFDTKKFFDFIKLNKKNILFIAAGIIVLAGIIVGIIFACNKSRQQEIERAEKVLHYPSGTVTAGISGRISLMQKVALHVERDKYSDKSGDLEFANATEEEKQIVAQYKNLGICQTESGNLNIRETPDTEGALCGKLPNNAACDIIGDNNGWYHIVSDEIEGYVKSEYIVTGDDAIQLAYDIMEKVAVVTADSLRVRSEMNTDSEIITSIPNGEKVTVAEEYDDWIALEIDDEVGYCSKEFVDIQLRLRSAMTLTEARFGEGVSDGRAALVTFALQYVGNRYVWGGTSLTKGVDCSGFTMQVYKQFGYSLPHYSGAQAKCGKSIKLSEAQPGDLVFYGRGKTIGHVAIYMGNGQIVHASNKREGIKVSSVYYRNILKVVRILDF